MASGTKPQYYMLNPLSHTAVQEIGKTHKGPAGRQGREQDGQQHLLAKRGRDMRVMGADHDKYSGTSVCLLCATPPR